MTRILKTIKYYINYLLFADSRRVIYVLASKEEVMHNTDTQHSRRISSHENTSIMHNLHQNCVSFSRYPNINRQINPLDYRKYRINQKLPNTQFNIN